MNPFIYPALLVLCVCSVATRQIRRRPGDTGSAPGGTGPAITASVWAIAACALASVGLAATTRTGNPGAIVTSAVLIACLTCMAYATRSFYRFIPTRIARS